MSEIADRYRRLAEGFTRRVAAVPAGDERWTHRSPCPDWDATGVVDHLVGIHRMFFRMIDHEVPEPPAVADDPLAAWAATRDAMAAALDDPEVAGKEHEGSFGKGRWDEVVSRFVLGDVLVHTWDLARALGEDDGLDTEEVRIAHENAKAFGDAARQPGVFGPEVEPPEGADDQDRFLAFIGRDPRW